MAKLSTQDIIKQLILMIFDGQENSVHFSQLMEEGKRRLSTPV